MKETFQHFYPRPPGGGRPSGGWRIPVRVAISIHALRVEGDRSARFSCAAHLHFYPRPPGGGRHVMLKTSHSAVKFLSTPSGWRATCDAQNITQRRQISIHALRVEGDISDYGIILYKEVFLSTPSGWRATLYDYTDPATGKHFYPRPPGGGRRRICTASPFGG